MSLGKSSISRAAGASSKETDNAPQKFVSAPETVPEPKAAAGSISLDFVPVDSIYPSFDEDMVSGAANFDDIVSSVKQYGILVPLLLRRIDAGDGTAYRVLWGHKRFYAAKKIGLATVPAEIIVCDDARAAEIYAETTKDCVRGEKNVLPVPVSEESEASGLPTYLL